MNWVFSVKNWRKGPYTNHVAIFLLWFFEATNQRNDCPAPRHPRSGLRIICDDSWLGKGHFFCIKLYVYLYEIYKKSRNIANGWLSECAAQPIIFGKFSVIFTNVGGRGPDIHTNIRNLLDHVSISPSKLKNGYAKYKWNIVYISSTTLL